MLLEYLSISISAIQAVHLKLRRKLSFISCELVATLLVSVHIDFRISDLIARDEFHYENELKIISSFVYWRAKWKWGGMFGHCKVAQLLQHESRVI